MYRLAVRLGRVPYALQLRKPRMKVIVVQVNQTWVTQLQLEMLATPAQSALLISRSASKVSF